MKSHEAANAAEYLTEDGVWGPKITGQLFQKN